MNRKAAVSGAFNAFGSISWMLTVKRIWTCHMEFALYKLIIIIIMIYLQKDFIRILLVVIGWRNLNRLCDDELRFDLLNLKRRMCPVQTFLG